MKTAPPLAKGRLTAGGEMFAGILNNKILRRGGERGVEKRFAQAKSELRGLVHDWEERKQRAAAKVEFTLATKSETQPRTQGIRGTVIHTQGACALGGTRRWQQLKNRKRLCENGPGLTASGNKKGEGQIPRGKCIDERQGTQHGPRQSTLQDPGKVCASKQKGNADTHYKNDK